MAIPLQYLRPSAPRTAGPGRAAGRVVNWPTELFMMFAFSIYSGAITPAIRYARGEEGLLPGETDVFNTCAQLIILGVISAFVLRNARRLQQYFWYLLPYIAIVALCIASTLWSQFPLLTLRRCLTLSVCVLFGIFCADKAGLPGTIRILGRTTLVLGVLSVIAYVAVPRVGHEIALGYSEAMRGVFAQKNTLGEAALLGIVCHAYELLSRPRLSAGPVFGILLLFGCILLAKSATSALIALLVMTYMVGKLSMRSPLGPLLVYAIVAGFAIVVFVGIADPDILFAIAQRDSSFTGRLPLWQMTLQTFRARPWLGYGYSAFWNENSRVVQYIWQAIDWKAPSSHNGYIDILLQVGIPGLLIYVVLWTRITVDAVGAIRRNLAPEANWILMFMIVNFLLNLDEGPLPYPDQFTGMMPAVLIFLGRLKERRTA